MSWKPRGWILIGLLLTVMTAGGVAQVATTQVSDTIYNADGAVATGTVLISWPAFTTAGGESIASGSTSAAIGTGGTFSVMLVPNAGSIPMGSYYTVVFHLDDGSVSREYWSVPSSSTPVRISAIETTVLPTSVALQTVSKSYVDTAIAAAITGHPLDSTPYVLKSGDTMTGPLVLPADPLAPTQAADKNYVDENIAAIAGGLGQKVSTLPSATQIVTQPAGTQLDVNNLNDVEYASQYETGTASNGIANAVSSSDCGIGCEVKVEQNYTSSDSFYIGSSNGQTHIKDARGGRQVDSYLNPVDVVGHGSSTAQAIDDVSTQSASSLLQQTGSQDPGAIGLSITQEGLAGGSNLFPEQVENPPYFKMVYSALSLKGTYNTQGQHGLVPQEIDCFGVGDCLMGSRFLYASGGFRDSADEGAHPFDLQTHEDSRVFQGTCITGCSTGSTTVMLTPSSNGGTQGDGRFLIDMNPAKTITSSSTGGLIVGGTSAAPHPTVLFYGTHFPISVFLSTGQVIRSQSNDQAPGTITFPIATAGVPSGYATNTAAIGSSSGLACVTDQTNGYSPLDYEMAPYTVVDATHLRMTLNKPHQNLATLSFGGLCGYGVEQTVDTVNGIRQLFPVIGAYSPTGIYYAAASTAVLGQVDSTSGFLNTGVAIATATRAGNIVTVTVSGILPKNINGLTATISGVADSSYNGNYVVTTTGFSTFTYAQIGANSSSAGGGVSVLTGGFAFYPMAEVLSVFDQAARSIDGQMTLAPNNVAWAANDPVEQPHYYQELVAADIEYVGQTIPRPQTFLRAGLQYEQNNGPGLIGWSIANAAPSANYIGYGGTHGYPEAAYETTGIWRRSMNLTAGEQAVFAIHCNLHGCGNWNSPYNLFELDSSAGTDTAKFDPTSSTLSMILRGTGYSFSPTGFTAGTINAGVLNATAINGSLSAASITSGMLSASVLPLFGPSGSAHSVGAVPDPGTAAGSTRFLREDGTWAAPSGGGGGGSGSVAITGGTIDGTVIGATTPAAISATQLNGVPVGEYTSVPRKPLATLLQALHNAKNQAVNIVVMGDSYGICDYANCSSGATVPANRYTEQLRINLQAQYGSHGTGMVPLVALIGPTLNSEEWAVSGTWGTVNTLGPYQAASVPGSALVHLSNGAVATFTSTVPYDTINTYCMTAAASGSIAVAIDGVFSGTACGSTTSSPTAHAVASTAVSLGTHVTTFTSTGDSYIYAAEGTSGTTGVSIHNLSVGSAAAEWFGLNTATQLAFSDIIPGGTQGVVTMLQTNEPGVGYSVSSFTSAMTSIITHEQALSGSPSVMVVVPPVDIVVGTAPYTSAQIALAQQQNVAFVNVQDRWGTTYVPASGLWDIGTVTPGIHPNDKGARDLYSMVYAGLIDPVPFGAGSSGIASSISGLIAAGSGIVLTGSGSSSSPYTVSSTAGCATNCTLTGKTTLSSGSQENVLAMTSSNALGTYFTMGGTASGVDLQGFQADSSGNFLVGDFTVGSYVFKSHVTSGTSGYITAGNGYVLGWNPSFINTDSAGPDTGLSRTSAGSVALGNGVAGDTSGSLSLSTLSANLHKGPPTAPSGTCSSVGWAFSQDGHATFCNGSIWVTKI